MDRARVLPATLVLLTLLLLPAAQAGSEGAPEIKDAGDDAGAVKALDVQSVWIDVNDTLNLTFHIVLGDALPDAPSTSQCNDDVGCAWASLTYRVVFRVLGPDGKPLPMLADYNRTYVAYRHGANGTLASAVGAYDSKDALALNGSANVTVSGSQIVLRVPRSNPAVNMPEGATPGTVIDRLYVYDSPQACTPAPQAPCTVPKPTVTATPGPEAVDAPNDWDRAPDAGYANETRFPAPPPPAPAPGPSPSPSPAPAPKPVVAPAPATSPTASPTPSPALSAAPLDDSAQPAGPKGSPGPSGGLLLAGLLACALALRRAR
jgi:hypothetical protein